MPAGSATGEFTFAALGENEKDFAELKAWYTKVRELIPVFHQQSRFMRVKEIGR